MTASRIICKNCGVSFTGHYCNNCGQDAHSGRINAHFLIHEVQHGIWHVDKGVLFTLKQLFTRPGFALRDFIAGKRVRYFKPLSFLLLFAGLDAFIYHYLKDSIFIAFHSQNIAANNAIELVNEWSKTHYALLVLLQLPLVSFICFLLFKKYGTNYIEQLAINAYLSGQRILVHLVLLPFVYLMPAGSIGLLYLLIDIIIPLLLFTWAYKQFYFEVRAIKIIWKAVSAYVLYFILVNILVSLVLTVLASVK